MSEKQDVFRLLKERFHRAPPESWEFRGQQIRIPKGSLIEIVGGARFEMIIEFFSESPALKVAWVEPEWSLFPPAVLQRGVDVTRWLLLEAGEQALWVVEELLASHFFSTIVVADLKLSYPVARRLQFACKKADTSLFLLSEKPQKSLQTLYTLRSDWGSLQGELRVHWERCRQDLSENVSF